MLFRTPRVAPAERAVVHEIDALQRALRYSLAKPRRWNGSLRRLSFARAIQGSNSIEGYDAALDDAAAVALGEEPLDADSETTLALEGYRNAMTYVLQLADERDFTYDLRLVKSLHFMMTSYHLANRPGQWRTGDIYVRNDATGDVVYEGAPPDDVPDLMAELVGELNADTTVPYVIRAAMAHLNLVLVHPFRDGNGRMARCLQSLVLARAGAQTVPFVSIEEYLGHNTAAYYAILAEVGAGHWQPERDARPWVRFTLTAHLRQARTTQRRIEEASRMSEAIDGLLERHGLPVRAFDALYDAAYGLRVRNATYRAALASVDEPVTDQTASRDFRNLVAAGLLVAHGAARGRYYTASDKLRAVRQKTRVPRDPAADVDPFAK